MQEGKTPGDPPPGKPGHDSCWEQQFQKCGRIWGDQPGELASVALDYIGRHSLCTPGYLLADLGCGYGRDSLYIAQKCAIRVYGIDSSLTAIEAAKKSALDQGLDPGMFHCGNFLTDTDIPLASVAYSSNVYQILRAADRAEFREQVRTIMGHGGILFLSTLSVNDPEHYGKGIRIDGETDSIIEPETGKYLHLSTKEEIARDFAFLTIVALFELEYVEPRTGGDHHHKSWILAGRDTRHFR
jgi:SAM-dependent methyltransferase